MIKVKWSISNWPAAIAAYSFNVSLTGICLTLIVTAIGANAAPVHSFLHTRGQDIVNDRDEKILLRGVGLGNWMLPEGYMWKFGEAGDRPRKIEKLVDDLIGSKNGKRFWAEFRKNYIAEADVQRIAELGYNSIRPALNSRLFISQSGMITGKEDGFQLLDNLIAWSKIYGLYVIIDMHGAPGGQTGHNIDDSVNDEPALFMEPKHQDQLVALWQFIAQRYKDETAVAGYDLLNEPLPERTGAAKKFKSQLEPLYKRLTEAIREVDPKHLIILEGADWANDWTVFSTPFDKNLVYQFHYYCWDTPATVKGIRKYLDYRAQFNAPVWVGETGERDATIYWATTELFEANNIGWAFWPWKKMDTLNTPYSIKLPAQWSEIATYSQGGKKPSSEVAQKAFAELLVNIRLENCTFAPDIVNAMFRRAPGRIEAENYGLDGQNKSYFVHDTQQLSKNYRLTEPIFVTSLPSVRKKTDQYITINAKEWTTYTVSSPARENYHLVARLRARGAPAEIQITIGDNTRSVRIPTNDWAELDFGFIALCEGPNQLKCLVLDDAIDFDWVDLRPVEKERQTAAREPLPLPK
jgi:endoglucanase